ncbi:MAG: RNA-binding protein, partial [Bdellovibrionales bacterium]|nr:RNA-binding protein [Bdellovibrionales bacterium]
MANKIYVGNLSYDLTEENLKSLFSKCGELLEVKIVKDSFTGKARGFGFVSFSRPEAIEKALTLDGTALNGRHIRVSVAQHRGRGHSFFPGRGAS